MHESYGMGTQSLHQYLSTAVPAIPIQGVDPSRNTPDPRYDAADIKHIARWPEFDYEAIAPEIQAPQLSPVTFDGGSAAALVDQFRPQTAYVVVGGDYATSTNRGPGNLKVSWNWSISLRFSAIGSEQEEYKQALSQLNFYMRQHRTRYGFILTNTE